MITSYLTDIINIVTVKIDINNVINETVGPDIRCRIEDENKLIIDSNGKEVMGQMLIILDKNTTINHQDKIIIKKKHDITYPYDTKKFQTKEINTYGMFKRRLTEVII